MSFILPKILKKTKYYKIKYLKNSTETNSISSEMTSISSIPELTKKIVQIQPSLNNAQTSQNNAQTSHTNVQLTSNDDQITNISDTQPLINSKDKQFIQSQNELLKITSEPDKIRSKPNNKSKRFIYFKIKQIKRWFNKSRSLKNLMPLYIFLFVIFILGIIMLIVNYFIIGIKLPLLIKQYNNYKNETETFKKVVNVIDTLNKLQNTNELLNWYNNTVDSSSFNNIFIPFLFSKLDKDDINFIKLYTMINSTSKLQQLFEQIKESNFSDDFLPDIIKSILGLYQSKNLTIKQSTDEYYPYTINYDNNSKRNKIDSNEFIDQIMLNPKDFNNKK